MIAKAERLHVPRRGEDRVGAERVPRRLEQGAVPGASGRRTILTRMEPGARLPRHRHVGLEQSFILEGSLVDDDGECTAGNFVWRRPGSIHHAWSPKRLHRHRDLRDAQRVPGGSPGPA